MYSEIECILSARIDKSRTIMKCHFWQLYNYVSFHRRAYIRV